MINNTMKFFNSDLYQYNESSVYLSSGMENNIANFDVYYRGSCSFTIVTGIDEILDMIEQFMKMSATEKKDFFSTFLLDTKLINYLSETPFSVNIKGLKNGDIVFPNEPILSIKGPIIQSRILETPILNILQYHLECSKEICEIKKVSNNKKLVYFGIRRSAGLDASLISSKVTKMLGFDGFSSVLFEKITGEKSSGTISHSYVQSFGVGKDNELKAFNTYIKNNLDGNPNILLIDTYNSIDSGISNAIKAFKNNEEKIKKGIYGVRIDSGNIEKIVEVCRNKLNENKFNDAVIVVSGGLDSFKIRELEEKGAPIDIYGIGDSISKYNLKYGNINIVYKLSEYNNKKVLKLSDDKYKQSVAGEKTVIRVFFQDDFVDIIFLFDENVEQMFKLNKTKEILEIIKENLNYHGINKEIKTIKLMTLGYLENGKFINRNRDNLNILETYTYFNEEVLPILKKMDNKLMKNETKTNNSTTYDKVIFSKKLKQVNDELLKKLGSIKNNGVIKS